ncbi:MAG TPA: hypothetical protein PK771_08855, partial [Spirochaetota bacterium]|nr:hypothetical protein [Spirochaetota bacterium]
VESLDKDKNGFTNLKYNININFKYDKRFKVKYTIFDEDNSILFSKEQDSEEDSNNIFYIKNSFNDLLSHRIIRYNVISLVDNKEIEMGGEFINDKLPYIEKINFGPIISTYIENKLSISSSLELLLKNVNSIEWIRFIPPSEDFFWDAPYSFFENNVVSKTVIFDKRKPTYFDNGIYLIQINFGNYGLIQKELKLTDIFGNTSGRNYGFPVAEETLNDKTILKLSLPQIDKIERMELELFEEQNKKLNKIGIAKFISPIQEINKKELMNIFTDEYNEPIKLKFNKKYQYRIILYSKDFNGITYQSVSNTKTLLFPGFSFW